MAQPYQASALGSGRLEPKDDPSDECGLADTVTGSNCHPQSLLDRQHIVADILQDTALPFVRAFMLGKLTPPSFEREHHIGVGISEETAYLFGKLGLNFG